ncbi:uncharacterized protein MONBRDRAFT_19728 [Monosiga brevicollis MX1]|uniref:Eukaryotic translation initiation factor 3 subunit D n=1 Tax=Monosiga brevicollis TaxID=81824 RepID=A9UR66_MONBE|nr:uncharacterized protein MONBRDRAFT_19728 [Monosiga brevicollis MX1]EDQ91867.1 predicted protein [Monosiga brevicollis MX1]|eukprot:XP_001743153.1 hypothetical protein [Monosiga brevicollis MX1]
MAAFSLGDLHINEAGWGPEGGPKKFEGIPYQPFRKTDRIATAADFVSSMGPRAARTNRIYGDGEAFAYYHDDDSSFRLVDTAKARPTFRTQKKWQNKNRRHVRTDPNRGVQQLAYNKNRERDRRALERKLQKKWGQTAQRRFDRNISRKLEASLDVRPSWELLEDIEFAKFAKFKTAIPEVSDYKKAGELYFLDQAKEKTVPKRPVEVPPDFTGEYDPFSVPASEDPVLQKIDRIGRANVFATDDVLATFMAATRSHYSWDIVATKKDGKIYFDKRPGAVIDMLSVDETAFQPPSDEGDSPNAPGNLSVEATHVNQMFKDFAVNKSGPKKEMKSAHDFKEEADMSVAYRYRVWDLGSGIQLAARTQHDAMATGKDGKSEYCSVNTLLERVGKGTTLDWRTVLASQKTAVLASQLKDNAFKLARWTICSLLGNNSTMRLGYVSRANPASPRKHVLLKVDSFRTEKFAEQIGVNMANGWGIVKSMIVRLQKHGDGQYVLMKDPGEPMLKMYRLPEEGLAEGIEDDGTEDGQSSSMAAGIFGGSANM